MQLSVKTIDRRLVLLAGMALIFEFWILLSDYHFLWKAPVAESSAPRIAWVQNVEHQAKTRSPSQLNWTPAREGQELYEGDEVATLGESALTLRFVDGQVLNLGANSLLVLKRAENPGRESVSLVLVQGTIEQTPQPEQVDSHSSAGLEIEVGQKRIISKGGAGFKVESSAQLADPLINIQQGNVEVRDAVPASVAIGALSQPAPSLAIRASFLRPKNGEKLAWGYNGEGGVRLEWKVEDSERPIVLELAKDPSFAAVLLHQELSQAPKGNLLFRPPGSGHYFWRMSARRGGKVIVTPSASFDVTVDLAAPALHRPKIESETGGDKSIDPPVLRHPVIHYPPRSDLLEKMLDWVIPVAAADESQKVAAGGGQSYSVDLEWGPVSGAGSYVLQISSQPAFNPLIAEVKVGETRYTWKTVNPGEYYWRVAGVDASSDRGHFSEFNTFSIKAARNAVGDETSYDTYMSFDDYSHGQNRLKVSVGPSFTHYYFSGGDSKSPMGINLKSSTLRDFGFAYDYRISPYYSFQASARIVRYSLGADNFQGQLPVDPLKLRDDMIAVGLERRVFEPHYFYSFRTGVRVSYIDLPVLRQDGNLDVHSFGFFGAYLAAAIHTQLGAGFSTGGQLGGMYQNTGDSYRLTQYTSVDLSHPVTESFSLGISLEEILSGLRMDSDDLVGDGHSLDFRTLVFGQVAF